MVVLVGWMLIDGFVAATRELATMNRELEQRVEAQALKLHVGSGGNGYAFAGEAQGP